MEKLLPFFGRHATHVQTGGWLLVFNHYAVVENHHCNRNQLHGATPIASMCTLANLQRQVEIGVNHHRVHTC